MECVFEMAGKTKENFRPSKQDVSKRWNIEMLRVLCIGKIICDCHPQFPCRGKKKENATFLLIIGLELHLALLRGQGATGGGAAGADCRRTLSSMFYGGVGLDVDVAIRISGALGLCISSIIEPSHEWQRQCRQGEHLT